MIPFIYGVYLQLFFMVQQGLTNKGTISSSLQSFVIITHPEQPLADFFKEESGVFKPLSCVVLQDILFHKQFVPTMYISYL